jgi:hypothetical protein
MNSKQIVDDIDFVSKYEDINILIDEHDGLVIKLYTIYNVFDILKYMFSQDKDTYDIEDLETIYKCVYNDMSREVMHRYESRKRLLINHNACINFADNVTFLISISKDYFKKKIILNTESQSEEETIDPKKEIVNKTITILDHVTNVFQYKPFQVLILSLVIYRSLTFF